MNTKQQTKNNYLDVTYGNTPYTDYPSLLTRHLTERFNLTPGDKILDVGCGRGEFLNGFIKCGLDGYGVDQSDFAQKCHPKAKVSVHDLNEKLPYSDNFFDVVYSKSVIEHFYYPENLLSEIYRVLKPGGKVITLTPDWIYNIKTFYEDYTHRTPFTLESISDIHRIAGFENVAPERFIQLPFIWKYPFLNILVLMIRLISPSKLKPKLKIVRFSKEVMLLCFATKKEI